VLELKTERSALLLRKLFGKIVAEPYKMGEDTDGWIATFADPDGNYFQIMTPWEG